MPFGIGGSRSSSSNQSSSSSFDNLDASSFNLGGSGSSQEIAFEDLFAQLFGGASTAAAGIDTGSLAGAATDLFGAGGSFLENLQTGGEGGEFLTDRLARSDDIAGEQIDLLGGDIEKFLTESILPGINQTGISAGTFGGTRGEVARGVAGEGATREFARGATNIRANERAATDSIATTLLGQNTEAARSGIAGLSDVFGLADNAAFADLGPFAALAQILGDPTVLGESFGFDVGGSRSTGRAGSTSESSGSSSSRSFSLSGLGA